MYTVVRFTASQTVSDELLEEVGRDVNRVTEGGFSRLDRAGGRFSVPVASDGDWDDHVEAIAAFVRKTSEIISHAKTRGVSVVADVAIEPEDAEGKSYVSYELPTELLIELVNQGVGIGFTWYGASS